MWFYKDEPFLLTEEEMEEYQGFVYEITDLSNNKKYIGKKNFKAIKKLKPLKGQKRGRRKVVESDWMDYYGSSLEVKQLVEEKGPGNFYREILYLCKSKGEMGYMEAREQFLRDVLLDENYYNGIIQCKIHRSHVQKIKIK